MYGHRSVLLGLGFLAVATPGTLWALQAAGWTPLAFQTVLFVWTGAAVLAGLIWQRQCIRKLHRANRRLTLWLAAADHPAARQHLPRHTPEPVAATQSLLELIRSTEEHSGIPALKA